MPDERRSVRDHNQRYVYVEVIGVGVGTTHRNALNNYRSSIVSLAFPIPVEPQCISAINSVPNAAYSSCVGAISGVTCVPACRAGYVPLSAATGFALTCGVDGSFDGADATLACSSSAGKFTALRVSLLK